MQGIVVGYPQILRQLPYAGIYIQQMMKMNSPDVQSPQDIAQQRIIRWQRKPELQLFSVPEPAQGMDLADRRKKHQSLYPLAQQRRQFPNMLEGAAAKVMVDKQHNG